jgi:hypothetical protein
VATADRHNETAARRDGRSGLRGNNSGRFSGDRIGICKHFDFHESVFDPVQAVTMSNFSIRIDSPQTVLEFISWVFPGARQIRNAWPKAICLDNPLRRAN